MTPAARRGFAVMMTGTPSTFFAPSTSVSTATAPWAIASLANSAPCTFSPGSAINKSPSCTFLLEWVKPVITVVASPERVALAITATDSTVLLNSSIGLDTCGLLCG